MTEQQVSLHVGSALDSDGAATGDGAVVTRAATAVGARQGTSLEIAYAMLSGLARSQGRDLQEYAALVFAADGRLDV